MKMVVATADSSIAAADAYRFTYTVEGSDIANVGLGNSDCLTMTLSFWVRSSVTGTYGIGFQNSAETENYVDEYTISSADTWEKKVINIPARTSGTWLTNNGVGLGIRWDLGSGTDYNGTADSWQTTSSKVYRTSSCVNWIATSSATFYVTGVQLEVGTFDANSIPSFQFEDKATSLARCQRYFQYFPSGSAGRWNSATQAECAGNFPVPMRAVPTLSINPNNNTCHIFRIGISTNAVTVSSVASHLMGDTGGVAQIVVSSTASTPSAGDFAMYDTDGSDNVVFCDSEL